MSPRCKKPRRCQCPFRDERAKIYKPAGIPTSNLEKVILFEDELEAMRLCDVLGLTQEEAGTQMGISRGTIQRLLSSGRKKIIEAILNGSAIVIQNEI